MQRYERMFATFYSFLALPLLTSLCPPGGSHSGYLFQIPDKKPMHSWQEKLQLLTDRACVLILMWVNMMWLLYMCMSPPWKAHRLLHKLSACKRSAVEPLWIHVPYMYVHTHCTLHALTHTHTHTS